jgi:flagellar biosynthesis/type III secretory pathway protein FliH
MKTAVEFLVETLIDKGLLISNGHTLKLIGIAKEIEEEIIKKEREEAYKNGYANGQMDAFTK